MSNSYKSVSHELMAIINADQKDRAAGGIPADLKERDRARRLRVAEIVAGGGLACADDYMVTALIFQHGETLEHYWQAHELAIKAKELGIGVGAWLAAAALDRYLVRQGKPVKYGTQWVRLAGIYRVPRLDPTTTDEERAAWGVPPLATLMAMSDTEGLPPITDLGSLAVDGMQIDVRSVSRLLSWHSEPLPDKEATTWKIPSGLPVWVNAQGWHWADAPSGELQLGWLDIPYSPVLGHMVPAATEAQLEPDAIGGHPAIWVNTGEPLWTLYARANETVWAVTGRDRTEVTQQITHLLEERS